ncbi:M56 family metallopeptidase [Clostridiaceae bacterium HFYG-1003]|nr:M56 family metallopeptidase [Clostridiaceae bacterium HFYG-1003]
MDRQFYEVLSLSLKASWLIIGVLFLRCLLRETPKSFRLILWSLTALRLMLPVSVKSSWSLIPVQRLAQPLAQGAIGGLTQKPSAGNPVAQDLSGTALVASSSWSFFGLIWLIGLSLMLLYALTSYWNLRRKVRAAVRLRDNLWLCDEVGSPFILGYFCPRIYLPSQLEAGTLPLVEAHEQSHLARGDQWWKLLGFLLMSVHWFNPLVWTAYILFCRDLELTCDERVIRAMTVPQRQDYARGLLTLSLPRHGLAAGPLAFGEVGVRERIVKILRYQKPRRSMTVLALVATLMLAGCFLTDPATSLTQGIQTGTFRAGPLVCAGVVSYRPMTGEHLGQIQILSPTALKLVKQDGTVSFESKSATRSYYSQSALEKELGDPSFFWGKGKSVPKFSDAQEMSVYTYYAEDNQDSLSYRIFFLNGEPIWIAEGMNIRIYELIH